ncbi:MAG: hypothetical protein JSS02_25110 [Planctomycetes bacterium]|nr:hypothetical protein [Planctomycetota bacterium]
MLRAQMLLRQAQEAQTYGPELSKLVAQAQSAFNAGEMEKSAQLYETAAASAHKAGLADAAFQFRFTGASIAIKRQNWDAAATALLELAASAPQNPKTPQAHLLAAYALGKLSQANPTAENRERYARTLIEHRTRYPQAATLPEATWMLADLEERRGRLAEAIALNMQIPDTHKHGPASRVAAARLYDRLIDQTRERHETTDDITAEAIDKLTPLLGDIAQPEARWNLDQAEIATYLTRILLRRNPPDFSAADRLLRLCLANLSPRDEVSPEASDAESTTRRVHLQTTVRQMQVVSLAGQGKYPAARKLLKQLSAASPTQLLSILDGLSPLQANNQQDPFRDLGELQLEVAQQLETHRSELTVADQRRLDACLARGFLATGETQRAFAIYDKLIAAAPRDRDLMLTYASLLSRSDRPDSRKQAVVIRRKIEALHEPGSPDWYPARLELCRALLAAGDAAEARKLLQVTRLVFAPPGDPQLVQQFTDLETEAGSASEPESPTQPRRK